MLHLPTRISATLCTSSILLTFCNQPSVAQQWLTSWASSTQGPYPVGNSIAQPNLSYALPSPETGARDQTFRLIVKPDVWGQKTRLHFSNVFGTRPYTLDSVFVGLQLSGAALVSGTNRQVRFNGSATISVQPGHSVWSDPIQLQLPSAPSGRKLAVSLHVVGESGPMTWHAEALQTSYISPPDSGAKSKDQGEESFPYSTTSWFFLDTVDMLMPTNDSKVVVAFGDSITDGLGSTLNGDDRWPNVLSRRLHALYGDKVSVVSAAIGGNRITGPTEYSPFKPFHGGPSAEARVERDVLKLSGVCAVIWLEGINDFNQDVDAPVDAVESSMKRVVRRIHTVLPSSLTLGGTLTSALGSRSVGHGSVEQDMKRKELNHFIRHSGLFPYVIDFDAVTSDPHTGRLRAEFASDGTIGGMGDGLHPNRAGYLAMGMAIDLQIFNAPSCGRSR